MSNNPYYIYGEKGKSKAPRVPIEEPEGINAWYTKPIALTRGAGGVPPGAVSLTKIEVGDLISEGEIEGLVTGEFTYDTATPIGNIGWNNITPLIYADAPTISPAIKWLRSIYWNEVPVVSSLNEYNFTDINVAFTPGLPKGKVLSTEEPTTPTSQRLSNETTISRGIGERLRYSPDGKDFIKIYRILNKECKYVRINVKVGQLSTSSKDSATMGDVLATSVVYQIYRRPILSIVDGDSQFKLYTQEEIKGKISYGYIRSTQVSLKVGTGILGRVFAHLADNIIGWEIKVVRITPDSIDSATRNQTYIDSITEVYGDTFSYPCSAIVSSKFSAEFFSAIPSRAYDVKLLKVKIPANYDPLKKTYTGNWNGTFKDGKFWTDNPAWCYYDLITNPRYGLGKYIDSDFIDKWTLYNIGKYCDTIVDNGEGGKEPRFVCNLIITSREDAYKVINDFASIFRAITYYGAGSIFAVQDALKIPSWQFTNANVENGDFLYSSTSRRVRSTVAMVRYNDKTNFYKPAVEYVEDIDGIKKYGIREVDLAAFGCTSRGQALRYGRWALLSETLETESVSFTVGTEGARIAPGDIIQTFDANRHESRYGGRLENAYQFGTATQLTLDSYITGFKPAYDYKISVLTPTFTYDPSIVSDLNSSDVDNVRRSSLQTRTFLGSYASGVTGLDSGVRTNISFLNEVGQRNEGFNVTDYDISGRYVWMIENSGNPTDIATNVWDYWRALRIEEQEDGIKYSISAIEYNEEKFNKIESGLAFEQPGFGNTPTSPDSNGLILTSRDIGTFSKAIDYKFTISDTSNVAGYLVYVRLNGAGLIPITDSTYLVDRLPASQLNGTYNPTDNGTYYFDVYSVNNQGTKSANPVSSSIIIANNYPLRNITISSLVLSTGAGFITNAAGTQSDIIAEETDPTFRWQVSLGNNGAFSSSNISYRISFREPNLTSNNTPSNIVYYQATGYNTTDFTYQLPFAINRDEFRNNSNGVIGPKRDYEVIVEAMTLDGKSSAGDGTIKRLPYNILGTETEDIKYNNPQGFDILYVQNPPMTLDITSSFSDQWITSDGEVKINIKNPGSLPDDLAGAFIYTSKTNFTPTNAKDITRTDIQIFKVTTDSNPIVVTPSPNYLEVNNAYMAIAFYDTFDEAAIDKGIVIQTDINYGLHVSNVVPIIKRGGVEQSAAFQAWAMVRINNLRTNESINTLCYFLAQYQMSKIEHVISDLKGFQYVGSEPDLMWSETYNVFFAKNMPDKNYTVFFGQPYNPKSRVALTPNYIIETQGIDNPLGETSSIELAATNQEKEGFVLTIQYPAKLKRADFRNLDKINIFIGVMSSQASYTV